jgi:hypothetical protein
MAQSHQQRARMAKDDVSMERKIRSSSDPLDDGAAGGEA